MDLYKKILTTSKFEIIKKGSILLNNNHLVLIDFYKKNPFFFPQSKLKKNHIFFKDKSHNGETLISTKILNKIYILKNNLILNYLKNNTFSIIKGRIIKRKKHGFLIGILGKIFFCKTPFFIKKYKKKSNYIPKLKIIQLKYKKNKYATI